MSFPEKPKPRNVARADHVRGSGVPGKRWLVDNTWTVKMQGDDRLTLSPRFTKDDEIVRQAWLNDEYLGIVPDTHDLKFA